MTIHLLVNVSAPSTVWCSAVEADGTFDELTLMNQQKGQSILGSVESSFLRFRFLTSIDSETEAK